MTEDKRRTDVRNIAIIAHVDHGKTTLVDSILKQTGGFTVKADEAQEQVLDSNDLERERGITILAKCTSVSYQGTRINIVDTPGHADFGSEVERILKMVDGVLLLVDAVDGPMPQTTYVLRKALEADLQPIVVVNKMDRPHARPQKVHEEVSCLLIDLGAHDHQLDFQTYYASAKAGWASRDPEKPGKDVTPLLDGILKHVRAPKDRDDRPLQMQVTMLDYSSFIGKIGVGRVRAGTLKTGSPVALAKPDGSVTPFRVTKLFGFSGLARVEIPSARSGDIAALAGLEAIEVGDTVTSAADPRPLPPLEVDEPTISMEFHVNDSPFAGREGRFTTSRFLQERLEREAKINVGLDVERLPGEGHFKISGRGELHLSILIETMRREGFELAVSRPQVILKEENGVRLEPVEQLVLEISTDFQGPVFEALGRRAAKMRDMTHEGSGRIRLTYHIPARCLIGFKSEFLTLTRGTGTLHHNFHGYAPKSGEVPLRANGVYIAKDPGTSTGYALYNLQDRAVMFIAPAVEVYTGMIVGQNSREADMVVNPCKQKALTNMRTKASDDALTLTPPRRMSLEQSIEFIDSDELVEVTPKSIRLRKKILDEPSRRRAEKKAASA